MLIPQELPIDEVQEALVIVPQDHISKFETENPILNEELFRDINKVLVEKFKGVSLSLIKYEYKKEITIKGDKNLVSKA